MPTPKQMEKLASATVVGRQPARTGSCGLADEMPPEYWQAVLADPPADVRPAAPYGSRLRLSEMREHLLRVGCRRCGRTVEMQRADAVRLYGPDAVWKNVGQRLLDNTCNERTGPHEEDGCWPLFD